jgi:hypothetical protein
MTNPKNFVREARQKNIRYEYLMEAFACIGQQAASRMFVGKSSRGESGTLSAATLLNWKKTFEFVIENPDKEDNDPYQARSIEKHGDAWDQFVKLIKQPIPDEEVKLWESLPLKKLGDEAVRWGITTGVRNSNSLPMLLPRMKEMVERRSRDIWNVVEEGEEVEEKIDYRLKNIFELRELAKKRGITQYDKKKEDLIEALQKTTVAPQEPMEYKKMTSKELKNLAKERGLPAYNNLNLTSLVRIHEEYDEAVKKSSEEEEEQISEDKTEEIKEFKLLLPNGSDFIIPIQKDGMVNATLLCQAGGKNFKDYVKNKQTELYIEALKSDRNIIPSQLIIVNKGNSSKFIQGTWVHRLVAIDLARWVYPSFAVQMTKWMDELFTTGKVELKRPLKAIINLSEMDIEAEELEMKHDWSIYTNSFVLYVAYIGNGLVKVGSSDCRIEKRLEKHQGVGSQYPQFRIIGAFVISGRCIEVTIHNLLERYKATYNKQKEVFRPQGTLDAFLKEVENLLTDHDLRLQLDKARQRILELEKEILELKLNKIC